MLFHIMLFLDYFVSFFFYSKILLLQIDASEGGESEHDANDNLERDTTSEVKDTQCDGE